ncbi:MAG TPA: discoidin domain-containing protein [Verrucomicrobiae bacterium]|nr:discoidin domain-containing protein [Verrucomicrobiae bacterium]
MFKHFKFAATKLSEFAKWTLATIFVLSISHCFAAEVPPQIKGSVFNPGPSGEISVTIDGRSGGLTFDGVGAVSAGASTRLLIDYPEPQRSQILDYLFKPDYGAALQTLKVEIGADMDSTSGSEPSHEAVRGTINGHLGYEWWLMKEAKARNPNIKLEAMAWGAPGWVENFWSDNNIAYTLSWLDCAKQNGFQIDYLGGGNERGYNADYYIKLRQALDEHGWSQIKIVGSEDHHPPNYWSVATEMKTNAAFAAAVDVLGEHDICLWRTPQYHCHVSPDALSLRKPLWDSENSTQDYLVGSDPLARVMTRHYLDGGVTGNLNWALLSAMYASFPCAGTGLILADRPWSGYYDVGKSIWVDAHMTQFTQPGWRYLDDACGYTAGGASFVTLRDPDGNNYTMVIETVDLAVPETLAINVTGGLSDGAVQSWSTDLRSANKADEFVHVGEIAPENGRYRITIAPGHIYTLSTTSGQRKGDAQSPADAGTLMPLPYEENFESPRLGWPAKYFSDVHGRFEIAPCGGGRPGHCYRQVITEEPVLWHGVKMPPTTIMGDPRWWGDYEVSADALLEEPGYVELLGRVESQQHSAAGYHLQISDAGGWKLFTENVDGKDTVLASGTNGPFGLNQWHRLALHFKNDNLIASDDGKTLANIRDDSHATGQVGLRVSAWQHAQFDNVRIVKTAPWPKFVPQSEITAAASSEHDANYRGQIFSARNAIDGRVETSWRPEFNSPVRLPQSVTLDLGHERTVQGLACKPSIADKNNGGGNFITRYNIYLSRDGKTWHKAAAGTWKPTIATKTASWPKQKARYLRLEAIQSSRGAPAIAEINISTTPLKALQ